jgi:hypothetical protein
MPYGSGHVIRQSLMYAKPWQRYVIAGTMVVGGGALAVLGHVAGVLLAGAGAVLLWRMLGHRLRSRHGDRRAADVSEVRENGEGGRALPQ